MLVQLRAAQRNSNQFLQRPPACRRVGLRTSPVIEIFEFIGAETGLNRMTRHVIFSLNAAYRDASNHSASPQKLPLLCSHGCAVSV